MGSKRRLAKELIPILTKDLTDENYYVEPFVGGCNLIDKIDHKKKIGNDINKYLIALLKYVQGGGVLPTYISKEEYYKVKENKDNYKDWYVGFCGFCCSYRGLFFEGAYTGKDIKTKAGNIRNYQQEMKRNLQNQNLQNIIFTCSSYENLLIPDNSVIYCDIPYKNTATYYNIEFDYDKFWNWVIDTTEKGNKVFVSEYEAPKEFTCIWEMKQNKNLGGSVQNTTEKLFIYNPN